EEAEDRPPEKAEPAPGSPGHAGRMVCRRVRGSVLHELAPGIVQAPEGGPNASAPQEFVGGFTGSFPVTVVVDLDDSARTDAIVEMVQTHLDALVPIAVEVEYGDGGHIGHGHGLLE